MKFKVISIEKGHGSATITVLPERAMAPRAYTFKDDGSLFKEHAGQPLFAYKISEVLDKENVPKEDISALKSKYEGKEVVLTKTFAEVRSGLSKVERNARLINNLETKRSMFVELKKKKELKNDLEKVAICQNQIEFYDVELKKARGKK